jgi:formylglycine-generating enzyme required for sulfatase activity
MPSSRTPKPETGRAKTPKYRAFLSYTHRDNETDHDWIRLAGEQLEKEVRSLVGFDFPIFIDALDTQPGKWQVNHDDVLDTAPFLIPFVTPCFLKSRPCRREVRRFHTRKNKGIIVPVFYIGTNPDTDEERRIGRILEKYQGFQWRELREKCHAVGAAKVRRELRRLGVFIKDAQRTLKTAPKPEKRVHFDAVFRSTSSVKGAAVHLRPTEEARGESGASGLQFLRVNGQGFEEYLSPVDGAEMVKIPAGKFTMGHAVCYDVKPVHEVTLRDFCIDKYPVSNGQYRKFCDTTGRDYPPDPGFSMMPDYFTEYSDYPAVNVSWDDVRAYCDWAGKRLPTEAEWEKAARGQDSRKYPWGEAEPDGSQCNFADKRSGMMCADKSVDDGFARTSPVKQYPAGASPYGVMDMAGNVWEWCNDWYAGDYYEKSPTENPKGPDSGSHRVLRGGSWDSDPEGLRCAYRSWREPSCRRGLGGFRCAVDV